MAIINNANRGSHIPTLQLIDELLARYRTKNLGKYFPRSQLLGAAMPESLYLRNEKDDSGTYSINTNAKDKMTESLEFWSEYGLWDSEVDDRSEKGYRSNDLTAIPLNLPKRVLDVISRHYYPDGNLRITLDEFRNNAELSRDFSTFVFAMCFFLYQEESNFQNQNFLTQSKAREMMSGAVQSGDIRITFNKSEEAGVMDYGHLLGFLEVIGKDTYIVDPTRFVMWYLNDIFKNQSALPIQEFLDKLNHILPIFDTGPYQDSLPKYLNTMRPSMNFNDGNVLMSSALSLALFRLENMKLLRLEVRSDSTVRFDLSLPTSAVKQVTHIQFVGEVA
ncbi:protein DpdG [Shewanella sp. 3_MG-2023]|uniref:protein DpdG n=1 Tax=Shewanella sp. 3_MG-2023 TaxID=3062635 RepID=UPI0026E195A9|nr:protein DpdG [Shewanella sp. 3_MG-2023]MDO6777384.1 protein DpdG [Shewanella sp. 3_MG-2023]